MLDEILNQGIAAIKTGDKERGKQLLLQVLEADEGNEVAWMWLTVCTTDSNLKRECYKRVLEINPGNELARKGLRQLDAMGKIKSSPSARRPKKKGETKKKSRSRTRYILLAICAIVIGSCAFVFICSILYTPKSTSPQTAIRTAWINHFDVCPSSSEYGVLVSDKVNAYDNPELSGFSVTHIPHGTQVEILEESVGYSAWKLRYNGQVLYVDCPFVSDYDPLQGVQPNEDNCACR